MNKVIESIVEFNQRVLGIAQRKLASLNKSEANISVESILEEYQEYKDAHKEGDFIKGIDAIGDLIYFAVGVLYKLGQTPSEIFASITDESLNHQGGIFHAIGKYFQVSDEKGFVASADIDEIEALIKSKLEEFKKFNDSEDVVGQINCVAQILKFAVSFMLEMGISEDKAEQILLAIHDANMTKKLGVNAKRGDGVAADAVKPADFVPPEKRIEQILEA